MIMRRRRRRSRRGFVPQAQTAQQRLKHASAPPCFGQVPIFSKVHRREGYLASVRINLVIFALFFCSSAECSSPDVSASHRRRQRSWHRPGHHDQEGLNMFITRLRRRRPRRGFTPEATPRLYAAGAVCATTAKTCNCAVCAAKLLPSPQLFESTSPRGAACLCADEAGNIYSVLLLICRVFFFCWGSVAWPQAA